MEYGVIFLIRSLLKYLWAEKLYEEEYYYGGRINTVSFFSKELSKLITQVISRNYLIVGNGQLVMDSTYNIPPYTHYGMK